MKNVNTIQKTVQEFDLMMAVALTRIGRNVPSLNRMFAYSGNWKKDTIRNHTLIATCGPLSIANALEKVVASKEETGEILPSYLSAIADNLRRMADIGDDVNRPFSMPKSIPEKILRSYCNHLLRFETTVCRGEYLERFGEDGIRKALADHGCEVDVSIIKDHFEPMTITLYECDGRGYSRVAAVTPIVKLTLLRERERGRKSPKEKDAQSSLSLPDFHI